jgi:hypothetical protein
MTTVELLLDWLGKNYYYIGNDLLEKVEELKKVERQKEKDNFIGGYLAHAMRKNKLPYGIEYLGKVADIEAKAEKEYKNKSFKLKSDDNNI